MPNLFDVQPFYNLLLNGDTLITANSRQCAKIRAAFVSEQSKSTAICEHPQLYSLNTWVERLWRQYCETQQPRLSPPLVLNGIQRQLVWQPILDSDLDLLPLVKSEQLLLHADSAYRNLCLWQLKTSQISTSEEIQASFNRWFDRFSQALEVNNWIIPEQRQEILLAALQQGQLPTQKQLYLYGFDDIPPLTRSLINHAANDVSEIRPTAKDQTRCFRQHWPTKQAELSAAALWAKQLIAQESEITVGIIAPNLGQNRAAIEQTFIETFEQDYFDLQTPRYTLPFNFSAGTPLAAAPVIHDALLLMKLLHHQLPQGDLVNLLTSPFWLIDEQKHLAFSAISTLFYKPKIFYTSADLRRMVDEPVDNALSTILLTIDEKIRRKKTTASTAFWMDFILDLLTTLQWPGHRRLDSQEYQQVRQFQSLLEQFTAAGIVQQSMSFELALTCITQIAQTTPFQPKTPEAPIQILGALEGAALNFDYCWVLNCDNQTWPPPPAPNPLLPVELQRRLGMPNASAQKQLEYAHSLTTRLQESAHTVIFSHSLSDGDTELNPSGLITGLPHSSLSENWQLVTQETNAQTVLTPWRLYCKTSFEGSLHSWVDCEQAPPMVTPTKQKGGIGVLQWQAVQPFNAFCRYRLNIYPLPEIEHHLSAAVRGQITHLALALFWQQTESQQAMVRLTPEELTNLINTSVNNAVTHYKKDSPLLTQARSTLEQTRQRKILEQWLQIDKSRPEFKVENVEYRLDINLVDIDFSLCIDRIDRTGNELLLIDYKAGANHGIQQWRPDRMAAPQLPCYVVSWPEEVKAIAFAIVNGTEQKLVGVGDLSESINGVKTPEIALKLNWPTLLEYWQNDLTAIALEFKNGVTLNTEYDKASAKVQSDYLPLNRMLEKPELYRLWLAEQQQ